MEELCKEVLNRSTVEDFISKNKKTQETFSILPDAAQSKSTLLVEGPSGSGKELFARASMAWVHARITLWWR